MGLRLHPWGTSPGYHRKTAENQTATASAPLHLRERVAALRQIATDRQLLLLDCAIVRHAPFAEDGRTIWQILPKLDWFVHRWHTTTTTIEVPAHTAVESAEQLADGVATPDEAENATRYFGWVMKAIDLNRTNYYPDPQLTWVLRDRIAYWIEALSTISPALRNIIDYYLVAYSGHSATDSYRSAEQGSLHPDHRDVALALINDIFSNPFRPVTFSPSWRTDTATAIAREMYTSRDFGAMPILADALQDAGCDNPDVLSHCRDPQQGHVRGCWVVDLVLGKT